MNAVVGYLLDTNIVLSLMRANPLGKSIEATYNLQASLNRCLISVVTVEEMLSLGRQFKWGRNKLDALGTMLRQLVLIDINEPQILEAYGEIDHACRALGYKMGKNDVWIAATTRVSGATLLTTDHDFDHLHGTWIDRVWIDPNTGKTL